MGYQNANNKPRILKTRALNSGKLVVFALPLRDDGKVWSGRATFTASKPIEVEVLHMYDPRKNIDQVHGEPYHAVLPGNKTIAISHFRELVDIPFEINGTGMSSGTFEFTGSALVFHKTRLLSLTPSTHKQNP